MIEIKDVTITLAKKIILNSSIEKKYNFKKNQIFNKTGIIKRFVSCADDTSEKFAIKSAKLLQKKNNLDNVTHIVSVSNTPSVLFPSIANFVSSSLNLNNNVHCIGLNAGCTGFVDAILLAYRLIEKEKKNSVLITTSDTYSKYLYDRSTVPLFSDGGAAILINYSKKGMKLKDYFCSNEKNTQFDLTFQNIKKPHITMNGPNVLSFTLSNVLPTISSFISKNEKTTLFCHQGGKIICDAVKGVLPKKVIFPENYKNYGNLVSTSIPNLVKENKKLLKNKGKIIFSGFGVGLSQAHAVFIN